MDGTTTDTGVPAASPLFDGIAGWLLEQGLSESSIEDIVQGLGQRLLAGGIPMYRLSVGSMLLHPVFVAMDVAWRAETGQVVSEMMPRKGLLTQAFQNTPFFVAARDGVGFSRFRLEDPAETSFPMFERMREEGVTEYAVFARPYEGSKHSWKDLPAGMNGAVGAFSTRRLGGFTDLEAAYLESLASVFGLVIKVKTTRLLANTLMDAYLGAYSGEQVLQGSVARGDGREINCVVWYCDLRSSTALAERMELQDYLDTLDAYFDCTAGAVLDHGGEVLKFIGDAVMAIFPIDDVERPVVDMCRAALNTATDALRRADKINAERRERGQQEIDFGIAMHIGDVMYGNVGTDKRLDFTVIGPAVNQVTRLEGLCKRLNQSVIASAQFAATCPVTLAPLGTHEFAGLDEGLAAYTLADPAA